MFGSSNKERGRILRHLRPVRPLSSGTHVSSTFTLFSHGGHSGARAHERGGMPEQLGQLQLDIVSKVYEEVMWENK